MSVQPTTNRPDMGRRKFLARAIWGTIGATTAAGAGLAAASPAAATRGRKNFTFDVACLLNTFTAIPAEGGTDPAADFRGTTFYVEGELYPAGTIPDGVDDYDPFADEAIGHWMCRGWFVNRVNRPGEPDRTDPHVLTHQEYLIDRITDDAFFPVNQLTSSGLEGSDPPQPAVRSLIGGAGRYVGAGGQVTQHTIGLNITEGPNFRFDFELQRPARPR